MTFAFMESFLETGRNAGVGGQWLDGLPMLVSAERNAQLVP